MSVYSVNQVRHLYVVNTATDFVGTTKDAEGNAYLKFKNADGETLRSDAITTILSAKATKATDLARTLNAVAITADSDPVVGQNYVLTITYRQWIAASDEVFYHEWASAQATTTSKSDLYVALALNLAKNTAKQGLVEIGLYTGSATTKVTETTTADDLSGTYTELLIIEKEQDWVLGTKPQTVVYLDDNAIKCDWGTVTTTVPDGTGATITNGKEIADMEYFYLGERGDQYRNVGWPYVTPTKGVADSTTQYDVIDIHYAYVGANESVQKSEKTLTIACKNASGTTYTIANQIISAINTVAGTSIATLS